MSDNASTNKSVFEYEVLYSKRSNNNKSHKAKGLTQLDGILKIEMPPSAMVTLSPLLLEATNNEKDIVVDLGVTTNSSTCSSTSESDDSVSDDDTTTSNDDDHRMKDHFKEKIKKLRQKFKKKNNKKKFKKFRTTSNNTGHLRRTNGPKHHNNIIYSGVNTSVVNALLEKGGFGIDDIVILPHYECQITRQIIENDSSNLPSLKSSVPITMVNQNSIRNQIGATKNKIPVVTLPLKRKMTQIPKRQNAFLSSSSLRTKSSFERKPPLQPKQNEHHSDLEHNNENTSAGTEENMIHPLKKRPKLVSLCKPNNTTSVKRIPCALKSSSVTSNTLFFPGALGHIQAPNSIKSVLRPHQIEGVVFLWNCLTGSSPALQKALKCALADTSSHDKDFCEFDDCNDTSMIESKKADTSFGAILADEMGLGKTLMTITCLFALHRRNRTDRFIIVCPSSLVSNWGNEFDKWIGKASLPTRIVVRKGGEEGMKMIRSFVPLKPNKSEVLIISYDLFRMNSSILSKSKNIGLLVVDEGHRLKNTSGSLTLSSLQSLNCKARLLITGTPVQNNLAEFYNVVNFAIPGVLGDLKSFRQDYERPISLANNKHATTFQKEEGRRASNQLESITSTFMIRRLQKDVLQSLLPPRSEILLFCKPSTLQSNLYKELTSTSTALSDPLPLLTMLRKLCTHPKLLNQNENDGDNNLDCSFSGKLEILESLLESIRKQCPNDKVVVVSNFTSALSLIKEMIIDKRGWPSIRLDGTVNQASRQSLVDSFNRGSIEHSFIFLLSSKAGGCGLNLCKANRLIMVDGDWNPATDLQAMARIYRQGQTKSSYIYRLLTSGTVEEVIYQRQTQKSHLANFSANTKKSSNITSFTPEELRDCFTLKEDCVCDTKNKMGVRWPSYNGVISLREQSCTDEPLLAVAEKESSKLAFVYIVPKNEIDDELLLIK